MAWKHLLPLALLAAVLGVAATASAQTSLTVTAKDGSGCTGKFFCFDPEALTATGGQALTVTLSNSGAASHSLCFKTSPEACTPSADQGTPAGATSTVTVTAPASGTIQYYCKVAGHEAAGMRGNLTVQAGSTPPSPPPPSPPPSPPPQSTPGVGVVSILAGVALLAVALRRR